MCKTIDQILKCTFALLLSGRYRIPFSRCRGADAERMDRSSQFLGQETMYFSLIVDPAEAFEVRGDDDDAEMCFAFRASADVPGVQM